MTRFLALGCLFAVTTLTYADNFVYGNNAGSTPFVYKIDKTTGAILDTYSNLSGSNGRGVVVVGDTMYYTTATTPSVFSYTLSTKHDNGAVFSIPGTSALSTIAYDGTNFYIGDYSGTNAVYKYSPTGTLLGTTHLSLCSGNCDGLEYFQQAGVGYLIENRGDGAGPYDVYNLDGTIHQAAFISPDVFTTGIAFDGTDFFTSNAFNSSLGVYSASGTFIKNLTITGGNPLIEDLSSDYSQVLPPPPPPPGNVPEPSTFVLLGSGALSLVGAVRRRFKA